MILPRDDIRIGDVWTPALRGDLFVTPARARDALQDAPVRSRVYRVTRHYDTPGWRIIDIGPYIAARS